MAYLKMVDSAYNNQFAPGYDAYAAYRDGHVGDQPNYDWIVREFPHAHHLSITIDPGVDADMLDIETGAASPESAAGWYARQRARGIQRPGLYASASLMEAKIVPVIRAAAIVRSAVRLWSAHYSYTPHICGPGSCGLLSIDADASQWTDRAMGRDLDESLLLGDFFGIAPKPAPNWTETMMNQLPTVKQGDSGEAVRTVQGLCGARGHAVRIDGSFGAVTATAVRRVQAAARIAQDAVVGPQTWVALVSAGT